MLTTLEISLERGHAGVSLDVRRGGPLSRRRLGMLTLGLVLPLVLVIGAQAVGSVTGWYALDRLMNAPEGPWVYLISACTIGVLVALVAVLVARLRIAVRRAAGSWMLAVTLPLTALEAVVLGIGAGLLALFSVHGVADAIACARGVQSAC